MPKLEKLQNYINGQFVDSTSGKTTKIVNPCTGEAYAKAPRSNKDDIDAAMASATAAFAIWSEMTPSVRQTALLKIADLIENEYKDELVQAECKNTGKPCALMAEEEIVPVLDQLRFYAGACRCLEGKSAGQYMKGMFSMVVREPIGVCAQITPWNYPLMMAVWKFAPAIAAGNTVVLKPSETTPCSTLLLAKIMGQILPAGVFNVVCGERDTGKALAQHSVPAMVSITGSVRAGSQVANTASNDVKRVHLELGGKAPVVVFDDVKKLDEVVETIGIAGFFNAGQDCTAATRIIVQEDLYDDFVTQLGEFAEDAVLSKSPDMEEGFVPPLNNEAHLERVVGFVERLPKHARIVAGGNALDEPGFFFEPTVVADLRQDDEMIQEEVFGPIITVQKFSTEEEAVGMANGVKYGLASSIWTSDHGRAMRCSRAFDFGCVWINTHIPLVAEMPHGGFKKSGYGKDLSSYGFEEYTRVKHIMTNLAA